MSLKVGDYVDRVPKNTIVSYCLNGKKVGVRRLTRGREISGVVLRVRGKVTVLVCYGGGSVVTRNLRATPSWETVEGEGACTPLGAFIITARDILNAFGLTKKKS